MNAGKIFFGFLFLTVFVAFLADGTMLSRKTPAPRQPQREVRPAEHKVIANPVSDEVRIPRGANGHYWTEARIDGTLVSFVVDTGASHISLSFEDAEEIGLDPADLVFDGEVSTANGTAPVARVNLSSIRVGNIEMYDMPATISSPGALPFSLLGMNFLNRLNSFRIEDGDLVLHY
ncbi:retropepsin-like aspartic protease family protein [Emcibacter sp.]|uniref:retropepsin-like aspartic protease family protein n=1 Tax=Emcibacter sp. TaxID=1979954 RepID=UPI002AA94E19|nr:TIGR02281 family clan AA aspartic protease [Emcibacter sp.]